MLHFTSIHFPSDSFEVRRLCAESLRGDVENYAPFAELKEICGDFGRGVREATPCCEGGRLGNLEITGH